MPAWPNGAHGIAWIAARRFGYIPAMTINRPGYSRRSGLGGLLAVLLILWLIIGAIAAGQRHYYSGSASNCAHTGTVIVTIIAGPLNYLGANPKVKCHVPQPSK
jgi:hypothetical protein